MHHHNHYYGQTHILARYCELDAVHPPRLRGYLQHGWNIGCGWNPVHEFFDGAWRYVWSDAPMRRGYALGRRNYMPVGAPWLYLLDLEPDLGSVPEAARVGTLFFLFHGWEGGRIAGDHQRLISEIREVEEGPVTMSLYFTEYQRPEIRTLYERAGFDVITFGGRGWNYLGTDREFLYKHLTAMRRHRKVASNRLATATFYGASVGCDIGVYGDPMEMAGENPAFGGVARVKRLWPELMGPHISSESVKSIVDQELGLRWMVPPAELRRILFDGERK